RVEYLRRTRETLAFLARDLRDRTVRREVAAQNPQVAPRKDGLLDRLNHLLPRLERRHALHVRRDRLPGDRHAVAVEEALLEEVAHQRGGAAGLVQIVLHVGPARLEIGQERYAVARALKVVQRQVDVRGLRHRD